MKIKLDENAHSDVRRYPRSLFSGLVVMRLRLPTSSRQTAPLAEFFAGTPDVQGQLWILEDERASDWTPES